MILEININDFIKQKKTNSNPNLVNKEDKYLNYCKMILSKFGNNKDKMLNLNGYSEKILLRMVEEKLLLGGYLNSYGDVFNKKIGKKIYWLYPHSKAELTKFGKDWIKNVLPDILMMYQES
tara:strand:- start:125 stop:487 length:363 start_codon:yes stop_codon:yes gene_type:complete